MPDPTSQMQRGKPQLFRAEAVRRYAQGFEQITFPRLATPRALACLWVLLLAFLAAGLYVWLTLESAL